MKLNSNIKRTCSFFVSNMHLITMVLPYIYKKIENEENIKTILEYNLKNEIDLLISKVNFKEEMKTSINNINWNKSFAKDIKIEQNDTVFIVGSNYFINKNLEILEKEKKKNFSIVSCYEITQEQSNVQNILSKNNYILNTTGEKLIDSILKIETSDSTYGNIG